jgi:hypothetical protein
MKTAVEWLASNLDIIWEEKIIDLVELRKYIIRYDGYEGLLGGDGTYEFAGQYICQI